VTIRVNSRRKEACFISNLKINLLFLNSDKTSKCNKKSIKIQTTRELNSKFLTNKPLQWTNRNPVILNPDRNLLHGGGDEDFTFAMAKNLDAALTRNGLEHTFFTSGGGHTWANWRIYLNNFAP